MSKQIPLSQIVPAGTVIYVARSTAPIGYVKANGATLSRTTYADLFSAIGTTFGAGDGSTTFQLPDMRGEFPRGWDDGRGIDSSRALGSAQDAAMLNHTHSGTTSTNGSHSHTFSFQSTSLIYGWGVVTGGIAGYNVSGNTTTSTEPNHTHTLTTGNPSTGGGTETRPRNIALLACIKI